MIFNEIYPIIIVKMYQLSRIYITTAYFAEALDINMDITGESFMPSR